MSEPGRNASGRSTLDFLDFENIRDSGIIETPTTYSMLVELEPREWLTLSEQRRSNVYIAFLTYLRGLQFPTQFFTLTTQFDANQYYDQFLGPNAPGAPSGESTPVPSGNEFESNVDDDGAPDGDADTAATDGGLASESLIVDSPLLEYGRHAHAEWLNQVLSLGDVRDRRFYVAVAVEKGEQEDDSGGRLDGLQDYLPIGPKKSRTITDETPYLDEVWARAQRVASQLPRTQVETTVLDSRGEILDVLYQSYRGVESPISFEHSTFTTPDQSVLKDPSTGDDIDLEATFTGADQKAAFDEEDHPPRPTTDDDSPFGGRVDPEYADRVASSRLLRWYAWNIGPVGRGSRYSTPISVYAGAFMFVLSLLLGIGAFVAFLANGQAQIAPPNSDAYWLVREASFVLASSSLPVFLLSLVVLLPSGGVTRIVGLVGTGITGIAVYLFQEAYPGQWDLSNVAATTFVVEVYTAGLSVLIIAVALAVRSRRRAIDTNQPETTVNAATDGGSDTNRVASTEDAAEN